MFFVLQVFTQETYLNFYAIAFISIYFNLTLSTNLKTISKYSSRKVSHSFFFCYDLVYIN